METKSIYHVIVEEFMEFGYYRAQDKLNKLFDEDKISLIQKGKIMDNLSKLQMMTSKELNSDLKNVLNVQMFKSIVHIQYIHTKQVDTFNQLVQSNRII